MSKSESLNASEMMRILEAYEKGKKIEYTRKYEDSEVFYIMPGEKHEFDF